jgi:hypothetical protein
VKTHVSSFLERNQRCFLIAIFSRIHGSMFNHFKIKENWFFHLHGRRKPILKFLCFSEDCVGVNNQKRGENQGVHQDFAEQLEKIPLFS